MADGLLRGARSKAGSAPSPRRQWGRVHFDIHPFLDVTTLKTSITSQLDTRWFVSAPYGHLQPDLV